MTFNPKKFSKEMGDRYPHLAATYEHPANQSTPSRDAYEHTMANRRFHVGDSVIVAQDNRK